MTMQKEYGRDAMRKFLAYESDRFLRERSGERHKENPLMKVESSQGYIHYQKGSMVMFYLKEMIGENKVNEALRELIATYAYKEPPYPTSRAAVDAFAARTPDSLKYLITDMFETITLFDNRTLETVCKKAANGSFETTIKVQSEKFRADSLGNETPAKLNDLIYIGVYGKGNGDQDKLLFYQKYRMTKPKQTFTVRVNEKPTRAGIDPLNILVDRNSGDNVKAVE